MFWAIEDVGSQLACSMPLLSIAATTTQYGSALATESDNSNSAGGAGANFDYRSGMLIIGVDAPSGSPTSFSVSAKLQTSPTGTGNWTDVPGAAITPLTAAGSASTKFNLEGTSGWIRTCVVPSFTGGTSPAIDIAAAIVLGGDMAR